MTVQGQKSEARSPTAVSDAVCPDCPRNNHPSGTDRLFRRLTFALFGLALVLVLSTFRVYGLAWDEASQHQYGESIVRWYSSGFHDKEALGPEDWRQWNLRMYGGLFETLAALSCRISPWGAAETRHLLNALFGLIGVAGCAAVGFFLRGWRGAFFSALALLIMPSYYGHSFFNSKDIPFAAAYIWSLYWLLRWLRELPRPTFTASALTGVAVGLTLAVRAGALLLFGYLAVGLLVSVAALARRQTEFGRRLLERPFYLPAHLLIIVAVAYLCLIPCWPFVQINPLNLFTALSFTSKFPVDNDATTLFMGKTWLLTHLPWYYAPVHLAVQAPEIVLVCLAIGVVMALSTAVRRRFRLAWEEVFPLGFLLFAVVFPAAYIIAKRSPLYDAARHVLFLQPPLAVFAALGAISFWDWLGAGNRLARGAVATAGLLALAAHLYMAGRLFPYEYTYYNLLTGGYRKAAQNYQMDYWALSYKELAQKLVRRLNQEEGPLRASQPYRVFANGTLASAFNYLPPNFQPVFTPNQGPGLTPDQADFVITHCRMNEPYKEGVTYCVVSRCGVALGYVQDLRPLHGPQTGEPHG